MSDGRPGEAIRAGRRYFLDEREEIRMGYRGRGWELRFEHGTSRKFYRVYFLEDTDANDYRTLFQWGRIGSTGQSKVEINSSRGWLETQAYEKRDEKLRKGYEQTWHREFDVVSPDVLRLAGVNERSQVQAQERVDADPFTRVVVQVDAAMRLATGTTSEQAQALVMARGLHETLDGLRSQVTELEASMEVVDAVILRHQIR